MPSAAIEAYGLSKHYRINERVKYKALRDVIAGAFRAPAARLRKSSQEGPKGPKEGLWALEDVSFAIPQGETVGIIGRNGAGKSTLLKLLARITAPTRGHALVRGRIGSLLEVGTGFHPELTGRENVLLNGAILGMRRSETLRKLDEIVAFAEVERFVDTPVKHYSSGMFMRLAFSVAAHLDPEILLVDEVLSVGDLAFQKKCLGRMGKVAEEGRTVLFVSHNMGAVRQLCTRGVLLEGGRLKKDGPVEEIVNDYMNETLAPCSDYRWPDKDAPADPLARMHAIRLCSEKGEARSEFGTTEPVLVEAEYSLFGNVRQFRVGFSLHSVDGTYLFYSADTDTCETAREGRGPGRFLSRCRIPATWLNVGLYTVGISAGIFNERVVFSHLPELPLTVVSTGGPTCMFNEVRKGVLAPSLAWDILPVHAGPEGRTLQKGSPQEGGLR